MKDYIKHIVEEFDFSSINSNDVSDVVLLEIYNGIFQRFINGVATEKDFELFDLNNANGHRFKYKVKNNAELHHIIANTIIPDLNWLDVSGITDMNHLFSNIDMSDVQINEWDVSNVTNMSHMFSFDRNFNSDISSWDVHNVKSMSCMFYKCYEFDGDITKWDVSSVENMTNMFTECQSFSQDLSDWDVSHVESMNGMFKYTTYRLNFDITKWDISSVKDMSEMFANSSFFCDLSSWDLKGINTRAMFDGSALINSPQNLPKNIAKTPTY